MTFTLYPLGWIRRTRTKTRIVLYKKYQARMIPSNSPYLVG
jgi:hypothetical protein